MENGWRALLLSTSVIILVFTVYCLSQGITIIFMHLYYFPIILLAYHYHKKGVILSAVLGLLYVALVIFFTYPVMVDIYGAGARFVVFVGIAAVVAYLSENLEKRERECSTIIANSEDGIFVVDLSRQVITEVNRRGSDMLGFNPSDLVNATLETIWQNTEERVRFSDLIKTGGSARNIEAHFTQKTGGTLTVLLSAGALPENRVVMTVTDITDRERMLSEVRRLSDVRESIISNANVWLMVLDSRGWILEWNRAAEVMSGYPATEVIGGNEVWKLLYPEKKYRKEITEKITGIINKDNYLENLQSTIVSKNGTKKTILWNTRGLPDKKGDIGSYIAIGVDITERKHAEMELSMSEEKFHTIADFTADWEYWQGQNKQIIYTSPSCERFTGYTQQEFLADSHLLETIVHPDDLHSFQEHNNVAWETRQALSTDFRIIHRDGTVRWIGHACRQVYDTRGKALGRRVSNRDITDRKRAENALRQANKQLNLLSSITRHDILNQLFALKGYIELSREYLGDNKTLSDFLAKEEKAATTIEHQIMFTKDYQELGVAAPEWQNVNASINKALSGLPMRAVRVEVDPKNPEVFADQLFDKVFYNLIDNALRYGGDQMKTIRVLSQESDTSLTILCEDDGVGITAEDKKRLFIRGFGKNTGLGLFLSREILAITGITIAETGTPGKGARFEITVSKGMWRMKEVDA